MAAPVALAPLAFAPVVECLRRVRLTPATEENAVVEGINNRMRMIARRAYGFHSRKALISMLFLCKGGIELNPPLPAH